MHHSNVGRSIWCDNGDDTARHIFNRAAEEIIDYFKPPLYFIENPQTGKMKDYISDRPYYDVDYCKYSDWGMRKRTRIWTNKIGFEPKVCNKDCGFIKDGRHIRCAAGGNKTLKGRAELTSACDTGYHHY